MLKRMLLSITGSLERHIGLLAYELSSNRPRMLILSTGGGGERERRGGREEYGECERFWESHPAKLYKRMGLIYCSGTEMKIFIYYI